MVVDDLLGSATSLTASRETYQEIVLGVLEDHVDRLVFQYDFAQRD